MMAYDLFMTFGTSQHDLMTIILEQTFIQKLSFFGESYEIPT